MGTPTRRGAQPRSGCAFSGCGFGGSPDVQRVAVVHARLMTPQRGLRRRPVRPRRRAHRHGQASRRELEADVRPGPRGRAQAAAPFDAERDYLAHVDGKPREDGVRDFLAARGIDVQVTRCGASATQAGAGRARRCAPAGSRPSPARSAGSASARRRRPDRRGVVEHELPRRAALGGIDALFDEVLDGRDVARLGLRGKPAPDGFLEAAARLAVPPARAIVVEDALAGVGGGPGRRVRSRARRGPQRRARGPARRGRRPRRGRPRGDGGMTSARRRACAAASFADCDWGIAERRQEPEQRAARESVFAVGNGYLGVRGGPRRALRRTTPA